MNAECKDRRKSTACAGRASRHDLCHHWYFGSQTWSNCSPYTSVTWKLEASSALRVDSTVKQETTRVKQVNFWIDAERYTIFSTEIFWYRYISQYSCINWSHYIYMSLHGIRIFYSLTTNCIVTLKWNITVILIIITYSTYNYNLHLQQLCCIIFCKKTKTYLIKLKNSKPLSDCTILKMCLFN